MKQQYETTEQKQHLQQLTNNSIKSVAVSVQATPPQNPSERKEKPAKCSMASEEAELARMILATRSQHASAGNLKKKLMVELEKAMPEIKRKYYENNEMTKKEKIQLDFLRALNIEAKKQMEIEVKDLTIPPIGKGDMTADQQKQGSEVPIHDDEAEGKMIDMMDNHYVTKKKAREIQNFLKSIISELEEALEYFEANLYDDKGKTIEKAKDKYLEFLKENFRTIAIDFLEPEAVKSKNGERCLINSEDEYKQFEYLKATQYENVGKYMKNLHWHKVAITDDGYRRIRDCSTISYAGVKGDDYKEDNNAAGKSRLERLLGKELFEELWKLPPDALYDNLRRMDDFFDNILNGEQSKKSGGEKRKLTEEQRNMREANVNVKKEIAMIIRNFNDGPLQNRIRILITGERRVQDSGLPGIMRYQKKNNEKMYEIFKELLMKKPETMSCQQNAKNNTDPTAGFTNVFRWQRVGFPIGSLYNSMKGTGHGDEGNYGINTHLFWEQADVKCLLPMGTGAIDSEQTEENKKKKMRTDELDQMKASIEAKREILYALDDAINIRKDMIKALKKTEKKNEEKDDKES